MTNIRTSISLLLILIFIPGCANLTGKPETIVYEHEGPRKILVFTDGTNNNRDSRTNVRRLYEIIANQDREDIAVYYDQGVGADWHKITGNAFGVGLSKNVKQAYSYLLHLHKNENDEIYLFGFSRGAYTARVLSGLIYSSGLINLDSESLYDTEKSDETDKITKTFSKLKLSSAVHDLYEIYRNSENNEIFTERLTAFKKKFPTRAVDIEAIGVWDTVDATGKPSRSSSCHKHQNHHYKVGLHNNIKNIYHALSIDEQRQVFWPVLYASTCGNINLLPAGLQLKETWFPGVHSDIGGGYKDSKALPGLTLNWMLHHLEKHNLVTSKNYRVSENPTGLMHESWQGTTYEKADKKRTRLISQGSVLHSSVIKRMQSKIPRPNKYREANGKYMPDQFKNFATTELIAEKYQIVD